jgi:hypothetical protein
VPVPDSGLRLRRWRTARRGWSSHTRSRLWPWRGSRAARAGRTTTSCGWRYRPRLRSPWVETSQRARGQCRSQPQRQPRQGLGNAIHTPGPRSMTLAPCGQENSAVIPARVVMGSAMPAWVAHACPAWRQGMITAKANHRVPGVCQRRAQGVPRVLGPVQGDSPGDRLLAQLSVVPWHPRGRHTARRPASSRLWVDT